MPSLAPGWRIVTVEGHPEDATIVVISSGDPLSRQTVACRRLGGHGDDPPHRVRREVGFYKQHLDAEHRLKQLQDVEES